MSKRIIISGRERILKPWLTFIMSFIMTGTGEVYSGNPQRGLILALLRITSALAIPFYSLTNVKSTYITETFCALLIFVLISLFSPFNAFFLSFNKKKIVVSKFNSAEFIILFALCNLVVTIVSVTVFLSFFVIIPVTQDYPPLIETGDVVVVKRSGNQIYKKGEMIVLSDGSFSFIRIIGQPDENVSYSQNRFSVQGSELFQSIFTEDELKDFSLTDLNIISESQDNITYPVIQNTDKYTLNIKLKNNEYFAAPDDRNYISEFKVVKNINILGRMEGLLFSTKRVKLLIKPFLISR